MSKEPKIIRSEETEDKPKEASMYLPADLKAQIEDLKIIDSEKLVDVVRRLVAAEEQALQRKQVGEDDTITLVMPKQSFARVIMAVGTFSTDIAEILRRSKQ